MSAATVITSSMPNVPVLSGTEGSLAVLIRYIAPILGWEIMFDNGPVIVVRPQSYKGGQSLLYRFDDRAARGGAAPMVAEVRAYESMSNINTGAGLVGPVYVHKSHTADSVARTYVIAGDQYGFYLQSNFCNSSNSPGTPVISYIGFNIPVTDEIPICVLFADAKDFSAAATGTGFLLNASPATGSVAGAYIHKNKSGTLNTAVAVMGGCFDIQGHAIGCEYITSGWEEGNKKPLPSGSAGVRLKINDGKAYTLGGFLPGYSRQSYSYGPAFSEISGFAMGDGFYSYMKSSIIIPLSEDFRPC